MSSRRFLFVVDAPAHPPQIALRAEFATRCVDLATVRAATTDQNGELRAHVRSVAAPPRRLRNESRGASRPAVR